MTAVDIAEFISARLDEDRAAATEAASRPGGPAWDDGTRLTAVARHINRHDPARVLREIEAKRAIVGAHRDGVAEMGRQQAGINGTVDPGIRGGVTALLFALHEIATAWSDHRDYAEAVSP